MELNDYQQLANKTSAFASNEAQSDHHITMTILGLCGEAGEIADRFKKYMYHGHNLNKSSMILELGDLLWYIAEACTALGLELDDVAIENVAKLKARYGEAFSSERSINRIEGA